MTHALDFSGKTVLVVGGSSGIGNGVAQSFRVQGAFVHVWGTRLSADDYDAEEGSDLTGLTYAQVDMSEPAALAAYQPPFDSVDVVVLSQGVVRYGRGEFEMDGFREVMEVNLMSVMACALKFQPMLAASKGSLIIISSTAAFHATRGNPAYNASKAGAVGLARTLAQAWAGQGIRVNGIAPGFVPTKLTKVTTDTPSRAADTIARIPLGRFGTPEDIAGVALFLASPLAAYVLGQTIITDGGLLL
ncbi:MAG: SDR family NAD(P)-dependent oxidoreductase [Caulobacterales bacterium]|jgi:3-oxoacyl-[acyl-carrier protein] reductase